MAFQILIEEASRIQLYRNVRRVLRIRHILSGIEPLPARRAYSRNIRSIDVDPPTDSSHTREPGLYSCLRRQLRVLEVWPTVRLLTPVIVDGSPKAVISRFAANLNYKAITRRGP